MKIEVIDDNTVTVNGEVFKKEVTTTNFRVGYLYSDGRNIILCTHNKGMDNDCFSAVAIKSSVHGVGYYSNGWIKSKFTPYNEPVTI